LIIACSIAIDIIGAFHRIISGAADLFVGGVLTFAPDINTFMAPAF
jgi:hypothetical protein